MAQTRKRKNISRKQKGGTVIYNINGNLKKSNEKIDGKHFFRKMGFSETEHKIATILKANPHPNIVKIYAVTDKYVDEELVEPTKNGFDSVKLQEDMKKAKAHLQSLGIIYIDWKPDNAGLDLEGNYKLYDFDNSGIINTTTGAWIEKPNPYWSYSRAKNAGKIKALNIDNYAFDVGIMGVPYNYS